jgi:hypothetical protein
MSPFGPLDFVYAPSRDVARELRRLVDDLGAVPVFAIEAFGTRVAMARLSASPPALLLAEHLEGERPILVHRVEDLEAEAARLRERGFDPGPELGMPYGPIYAFVLAGGHRIAIYELTRPGADERLGGRFDFDY